MQTSPLARIRPWLLPAACLLWSGYFAAHAVTGDGGLLALGGYKAERARLEAQAAVLATRRAGVERHVRLLDPAHPDRDYVDELVRRQLGLTQPDEVVVTLPGD